MQSLEKIAEYIHLATGYDLDALRTKKRDTFRVAARQVFCYYAKLEGYSFNRIGIFINIDHSTALHSAHRAKEMKDTDLIIKDYISKYEIMSKKKQIMEIVPPAYSYSSEKDEFFGFMCPSCNGRGSHVDHYKEKEPVNIKCERCDGSGKLKAVVRTTWEADK